MERQVDELIKTVLEGDEWNAAEAAKKLGKLRAKKAVPALITALHSQEALEAWNSLDGMTKVFIGGTGEGLNAIIELRCAAIEALEQIGDDQAIPELLTILSNEDHAEIHIDIKDSLVNFAAPTSVTKSLIKRLDDPTQAVREEIITILGDLGRKAENKKLQTQIVQALKKSLSDKYALKESGLRICDYAAQALETVGTEDAIAIVREWRQEQLK